MTSRDRAARRKSEGSAIILRAPFLYTNVRSGGEIAHDIVEHNASLCCFNDVEVAVEQDG